MSQASARSAPAAADIRPLSPVMAAEIVGADLSGPIPDAEFVVYRDALAQHKVLVFRDQHLDKDQLIAFTRMWGSLGEHIMPGQTRAGVPEVNVMSNAGPDGKPNGKHPDPTAKRWHTDRSYMRKPAMASLLYGTDVPEVGGDTLFANATMAYDNLDPAMRAKIDTLNAVHSVEYSRRTGGVAAATPEELAKAPNVKHPLARPHPVTGRKAIYCGCHAWKIDGWSEADSRPLLDELLEYATQERFIYRHKWRKNDLLMWDNRCTFHAATDYDTAKELRVMYRTVIEGEATQPV